MFGCLNIVSCRVCLCDLWIVLVKCGAGEVRWLRVAPPSPREWHCCHLLNCLVEHEWWCFVVLSCVLVRQESACGSEEMCGGWVSHISTAAQKPAVRLPVGVAECPITGWIGGLVWQLADQVTICESGVYRANIQSCSTSWWFLFYKL